MPIEAAEIDEILARQKRDHELIVNFQANTSKQKAAKDMTLSDYQTRDRILEGYWQGFRTRDYELYPYAEDLKSRTYFKANLYESGLTAYMSAKSWLTERITAKSLPAPGSRPADRSAPAFSASLSQLERVKLPKFDGTQRDWQSFKSKFQSLVLDEPNMSAVIKFQHLLNALEGEAEGKLRGLEVTGDNFTTAWESLCSRYDNIFLRFSTHFNALLALPSSAKETSAHLSSLLNTTNESINAFKSLRLPVEHWDMVFIQCIESKLAPASRMDWAKQIEILQDGSFPTFDLFKKFLEDRIQTLDRVEAVIQASADSKVKPSSGQQKNSSGNQSKGKSTAVHTTVSTSAKSNSSKPQEPVSCVHCQGPHFLSKCKSFAALSQGKRKHFVVSKGLCTNCFSNRHKVDDCRSQGRCLVCAGLHHTRLHPDGQLSGSTTQHLSESSGETNAHLVTSSSHQTFSELCGTNQLLATAVVTLQSEAGTSITARVLLDSCAEQCIISEYVVQALNLKRNPVHVIVNGTGGTTNAVAQSRVELTLKSQRDTKFSLKFSALVLRRVSNLVPRRQVKPQERWSHLDGLQLADPHFGAPSRVDCILSSAVFGATILPGVRKAVNPLQAPVAQETVFGWVLLGSAGPNDDLSDATSVHHVSINHQLTEAVAKFWETEEIPRVHRLAPNDEQCWNHFKATTFRNEEGRYVVRLPFSGTPQFPGIDTTARACMNRLERRFAKQPDVAAAYFAFMREYIDLGHMEVVPENEVATSQSYYLPHHPVFKRDSGKIRVVFNGSQKDARGVSLNSMLHAGPKLQEDLVVVLLRWCFFRHAFICDVVKMFRQMLINQQDLDWQRIFWRFSLESPLLSYRLLTVTYGTASAPFHANACLLDLAEAEAHRFPLGSKLLKKNRYVDDFLAGGDTLEEAAAARSELVGILSSAGMAVDKWAANHADLLGTAEPLHHRRLSETDTVSTLGLKWLPHTDVFNFEVRLPSSPSAVTKRTILSQIAMLFDPVGWVSPVVIRAKLLLQCLWLQGADWDARVTGDLEQSWLTYRTELTDLEAIEIPRWLGTSDATEWHLHGFCDASERAFAATIYVVVPAASCSRLLMAKSKVAPLKVVSLPKLELCGASLLARLISNTLPQLEAQPAQIHCWCDSQVVLSWLRSHPSKWKAYVANRVSEIATSLPTATWRHIKSTYNPADLATRGCSPRQLQESEIWWKGPEWLTRPRTEWPSKSILEATELESRNRVNVWLTRSDLPFGDWLQGFSSFDKMCAILAYVHRWRLNSKLAKSDRRKGFLSSQELFFGSVTLFRLVQMEVFSEEFQSLASRGDVRSNSPLRKLLPFVDTQGLIRVGGRLQNSFLSESEKHPIILPKNHHITVLLIRKAHISTLHGGYRMVHSYLLQRFWILRANTTIRRIVRSCVRCTRHNAITLEQQMAPLPAIRTKPALPFAHSGVDFAGYFWVKASPGRGQKTSKGYVAVFVCLVVKAIHLELVSDLTTDAFLAAYRRFTARRGLCQVIYSDNGTTFKGSEAELHRLFSETSATGQAVAAAVACDGVEWRYIPPRAPNFGGIWESNVKSMKRHLYRVISDSKLTYEQLTTVLASIEACLNSRPISALSSDPNDASALTPGHFLIGRPLVAPPEPFMEINQPGQSCSGWHPLQLMRNHFWQRWRSEYLSQLQQRSKWLKPNRQLQVGDLVLFKDKLTPPTKWPLARVLRIHPGKDGLARVATIRSSASEWVRPINKLIWLPVHQETIVKFTQFESFMAGGAR